ncbi:MAG TPA: acyl-CoA thioesterase [Oculatellaceae cyanobacterium]|jgi:acyl-CoA thioester hydrolase
MTAVSTRELLHTMDVDVNIFDTDCFGVMWHGAYTKWMEMGRVKLFEERGLMLSKPDDPLGYIYPVVEQNLRFKSPAHYQDRLLLTTRLKIDGYKLIFEQTFTSKTSGKVTMDASTTVVVLDTNWKLQRKLPDMILKYLHEA